MLSFPKPQGNQKKSLIEELAKTQESYEFIQKNLIESRKKHNINI